MMNVSSMYNGIEVVMLPI